MFSCFYNAAAVGKYLIAPVPYLLGDYCWDCFARFVLIHHPFFLRQELLLFGAIVNGSDFVSAVVAFVLGVLYYSRDGVVVYACAVSSPIAFVIEYPFYLPHAGIACGVQLEYESDHFGFLFVDDQLAVFFVVAEDAVVAKDVAVLDSTLVTETHTLGQLSYLVCGYA